MKAIRAALLRLAGLLRLTRSDADINEELQSHLMMLADEYRRAGLSDADARRAAAAKFGSVASAAQAYRERRGVPTLEQVAGDCRYAARSLGQTRMLSISVILVLALGIGVTTTLVTLFHAVAFRALPVPDSDRVVKLSLGLAGDFDRRVQGHVSQFSYPEVTLYQDTTRALSGVAGFRHEVSAWFHGGSRRPIVLGLVTANYFNVLQARPASGRLLTDADRLQPAAVISYRLWREAFGHDPGAIGASMLIDRLSYTVIGVAERSFTGTEVESVDVWVPLAVAAPARGHADRLGDASLSWLQLVGRLAPGASLKSAAVEAGVIAARYDAMHPGQRTTVKVSHAAALDAGLLQSGNDRTKVIGVGAVVVALAAVLLLICTSNAAALLLARASTRQREIAIRIALGAGRWRVVQQLMTESALLAFVAAVTGLALCTVVLRATAHLLPLAGYFDRFVPDLTVLSFASLAALAATALFGTAPALYATRVDPLAAIKQDVSGLSARIPGARLRHSLVAGQVAVSLVLLVIAGLLARGVEHALRVNSGFRLTDLYAITVDVPAGNSTAADRSNLVRRLALSLHSTPGVDVGLAVVQPFVGAGFNHARAAHMTDTVQVHFNKVDPGYFPTLGVPSVAGRSFATGDDRSHVIVNARLARTFWGDERAAIGQAVTFIDETSAPDAGPAGARRREIGYRTGTVVGVVPTLQSVDVGVPDGPTLYLPILDGDLPGASFVVRSPLRQPLDRLTGDLTRGTDAMAGTASIADRVVASTQPARFASAVTVLLGVLTLLVAAAGVYGIVAHSVVSRTREIGVHVALGATRARVLRIVLGSSIRAIGSGVALGIVVMLIGAFVGSEALEPILFGVGPLDPLALGAVIGFLGGIMGAASYLPARRALGVEPIDALRRI
jgi:macrolide transport system ATP-binding/permease protein